MRKLSVKLVQDPLTRVWHPHPHLEGPQHPSRGGTHRARQCRRRQFPYYLWHSKRTQPGEAIGVGPPRLAEK